MAHRSSHGKELPQKPPSLKNASGLSNDFEYAGIWTGQSNSLPWGLPLDAVEYSLELQLQPPGLDLASVTIPPNPERSVGMAEVLLADASVTDHLWNKSTWLRLGTVTAPEAGYAEVIRSRAFFLDVRWLSLPTGHTAAVTFDDGTDRVTWMAHGLTAGQPVVFTNSGGALPAELTAGVTYYVLSPAMDDFQVSATPIGSFIDLMDAGTGTHTGYANDVLPGYLVKENGKFYSYENCRVLTPYLPWRDIQPPTTNEPLGQWSVPIHSAYPVPDGPVGADGKRLTLPAPWTLPAAVTTFDDLAVFLPMTRREGADGYGISEVADATFDGTGTPTGHPLTLSSTPAGTFAIGVWYEIETIGTTDFTAIGASANTVGLEFQATGAGSGTGTAFPSRTFTFATTLGPDADLTNAYFLVDWESAGASKRSWARVASSQPMSFTVDATTWLGDGNPDPLPSLAVTIDIASNEVVWTAHGLSDGDRMFFQGTTMPAGVARDRVYFVTNVNGADRFQIAESLDHPPINFSDTGTGLVGRQTWVYTCWLPHWKDNPFTFLPGPEFAYPNEDHQPRNTYIHFRARGQTLYGYNNQAGGSQVPGEPFDGIADSRFGALLPFAWRTGAAIGKRLNMVALGVGSTPLHLSHVTNNAAGAFTGTVGWWNNQKTGFGVQLEDSTSYLAERIKRLITVMAPQALLAEGNAKELRYLSACHIQGEADAFTEAGRELYNGLITDYKQWLRDLVLDGGWSPFSGDAKMPFAQPLITHIPYEVGGFPWTDVEGEINNAIREVHTAEEFSGYVLADDLPKINDGHFSGGGMVVLGARLAVSILDSLEYALSYGSPALASITPRLLRIANLALIYIGQGSRQITSLSETTPEAQLISVMLPEATTQLLSMRQWSWARRREPAAQIKHDHPKWQYAYVVPGRAMTPTAITPHAEAGDFSKVVVSVVAPNTRDEARTSLPDHPAPFAIESSPSGARVLFTNVAETPGTVEPQIPIPSNDLFPERLPKSPMIHYVDKQIDPDRFSSSFANALTWLLASMLAPALVKGKEGEAVSSSSLAKSAGYVRTESAHETATQQHSVEHTPIWLSNR